MLVLIIGYFLEILLLLTKLLEESLDWEDRLLEREITMPWDLK